MNIKFRQLHRKIAPIIFLPLLASALTGIAYGLGRSWFGISNELADFFLVIHQGEYLGRPLVPIYVLLVGLGLLGMVVTGISMSRLFVQNRPQKNNPKLIVRKVHSILVPIVFLPLAVTAVTGIAFRLGTSWFSMSGKEAAFFIKIHQGVFLGPVLRPFYLLFIGLGLLAMLVTGINMTGIFRKRRVSQPDIES